jgi:hypothetical protein
MGTCPRCKSPVILGRANAGYCSRACRADSGALAELTRAKRKPAKRVVRPTEFCEHLALARWLDFTGVLWAHVPNGEKRTWSTARKLKAMGVKPGVPDILIFTIPPSMPSARGVAVELKRQGMHTCTPVQMAWMSELKAAGWAVMLSAGAADAIAWLETLGYRRR